MTWTLKKANVQKRLLLHGERGPGPWVLPEASRSRKGWEQQIILLKKLGSAQIAASQKGPGSRIDFPSFVPRVFLILITCAGLHLEETQMASSTADRSGAPFWRAPWAGWVCPQPLLSEPAARSLQKRGGGKKRRRDPSATSSALRRERTRRAVRIKAGIFHGALGNSAPMER